MAEVYVSAAEKSGDNSEASALSVLVGEAAGEEFPLLLGDAGFLSPSSSNSRAVSGRKRGLLFTRRPDAGVILNELSSFEVLDLLSTRFSSSSSSDSSFLCGDVHHTTHEITVRLREEAVPEIGRAVQQECRDRSRMPSSA
eukprot:TRINITY_DN3095_c0_g1_i10.p1 TRINITY_DN3095_c0_g1~~TRINITY_DN3095_c0_g1_i10.p1  ORF type:complete len:141 (+),score=14.19 TRINITY_DN3095_c0_g1_i10:330-752(+)